MFVSFRVDFNRCRFPLHHSQTDTYTLNFFSLSYILEKLGNIEHKTKLCVMWQILGKPSNPHWKLFMYACVFSNQTSVPLPFYTRKMWPLITEKKETNKTCTLNSVHYINRDTTTSSHLKFHARICERVFFYFLYHRKALHKSNPDIYRLQRGDKNLFNFKIWWLFL